MTPHKTPEGLVEWFEHSEPNGKTLVLQFVQNCGFGNQMFEIAAAYGIAKRTGCHLRWSWNPSKLRKFDITALGFANTRHEGLPAIAQRLGQGHVRIVREIERRIGLTEHDIFTVSCPFQDEKCFEEDTTLVEGFFRPNLPPLKLKLKRGETPVGVQVRRSDYVGHPRLDVVTPDYFLNAMEWMRRRIGKPRFFVVSDDPAWCSHQFAHLPDVTVMPPQTGVEGLRTLVACKAHVISNSTFGWWGAYLGEKGPVVVPDKWHHKPGSYGDWQPVPERWHRVTTARGHEVRPVPLAAHEVHEPLHDRAIVIPWKQDAGVWHELRYCLRAIHKFFEDREAPIYILGTMEPAWLAGDRNRIRFISAPSYREALVRGLQIADEVLWMNDDQLMLRPCGWDDFRTTRYVRETSEDFVLNAGPQANPWRAGCLHVLRKLHESGSRKFRVYSTHTPYVFERERAVEVLRDFGAWDKIPFELAYFHRHPSDPQELGTFRTQSPTFDGATILNYTDEMLTPELRAAVAALLPEYAPWELRARF